VFPRILYSRESHVGKINHVETRTRFTLTRNHIGPDEQRPDSDIDASRGHQFKVAHRSHVHRQGLNGQDLPWSRGHTSCAAISPEGFADSGIRGACGGGDEGYRRRISRRKQDAIAEVGWLTSDGEIADDAVDGTIGASKARYVGLAAAATLMILQRGGEAKLHKGDTIQVEPSRAELHLEVIVP
jgi:hypothetical protein